MAQRLALIIGNSEHEDPTLAQLKKSDSDVNSLTEILKNADVGCFDNVTSLINEPSYVVRREIGRFFAQKRPDDLLLLYFSGHGVKDDHGSLYLAVKDTEHNLLHATAVSAASITHEMDNSKSKRQVLILDCCHSGAFAQGAKGVTQASVGTAAAFQGNGFGRVVLTATDSTQYAWEGDEIIGEAANSVFTHYLIQGLKTGEADADSDAEITLNELYDYVYDQVVQKTPRQTPGKWSYKEQGDIVIARNSHPAKPADLAPELQDAIQSDFLRVREGAVNELAKLLAGRHKGLALAAQQALELMAQDDDSRRISDLAREKLQAYHSGTLPPQTPAPAPVTDQPTTPREPEPVLQGAKAAPSVAEPEPLPVADRPERQAQEERRREEEGKQQLLRNLAEQRTAKTIVREDIPHPPAVNTSGQGRNAIVPPEINRNPYCLLCPSLPVDMGLAWRPFPDSGKISQTETPTLIPMEALSASKVLK